MLRQLDSTEQATWLLEETENTDAARMLGALTGDDPFAVRRLVPPIYERYCKLLHPIYENPAASDSEESWDDFDRRHRPEPPARRRRVASWRPWQRRELPQALADLRWVGALWSAGPGDEPVGPRVPWKQLATQYGIPWQPQIEDQSFKSAFDSWPHRLFGPIEGYPDVEAATHLVGVLASTAQPTQCFFYYDNLKTIRICAGSADDPLPEDLLYTGPLTTLIELADDEEMGFPYAVWPTNRSWCLVSDHDLTFTLIGGNRPLINALLNDDELDTIEVTPDTRLDRQAQSET